MGNIQYDVVSIETGVPLIWLFAKSFGCWAWWPHTTRMRDPKVAKVNAFNLSCCAGAISVPFELARLFVFVSSSNFFIMLGGLGRQIELRFLLRIFAFAGWFIASNLHLLMARSRSKCVRASYREINFNFSMLPGNIFMGNAGTNIIWGTMSQLGHMRKVSRQCVHASSELNHKLPDKSSHFFFARLFRQLSPVVFLSLKRNILPYNSPCLPEFLRQTANTGRV